MSGFFDAQLSNYFANFAVHLFEFITTALNANKLLLISEN